LEFFIDIILPVRIARPMALGLTQL